MTSVNVDVLYQQAKEAISHKKIRKGFELILYILDVDFTNELAWHLLYETFKKDEPFESFQLDIANKYFPQKVHLLLENILDDLILSRKSSDEIQKTVQVELQNPALNEIQNAVQFEMQKPAQEEIKSDVIEILQNASENIQYTPPRVNAENSTPKNIPSPDPAPTVQIKVCQNCHKEIKPEALFCPFCGFRFNGKNQTVHSTLTSSVSSNAPQAEKGEFQTQNSSPANNHQNFSSRADENPGKKALWEKFTIPIITVAVILLILLIFIPVKIWLIGVIGAIVFFLWKLEYFPKYLSKTIRNYFTKSATQISNHVTTIVKESRTHQSQTINEIHNKKETKKVVGWGLITLIGIAVVVFFVWRGLENSRVDFCDGLLDCSQMIIKYQESCKISPQQKSYGINSMYILQVDLITPTGEMGRSSSIVATKFLNGWTFNEDPLNDNQTCATFLN